MKILHGSGRVESEDVLTGVELGDCIRSAPDVAGDRVDGEVMLLQDVRCEMTGLAKALLSGISRVKSYQEFPNFCTDLWDS